MGNILKYMDLHDQQVLIHMYRLVHVNISRPLLKMYEYHADIDGHNIRHASDPKLPKMHTELVKRSYLYRGPQLWMNLDVNMKKHISLRTFRRKLQNTKLETY